MTQPRYQELKGAHFLSQKGKLSRSLAIRLLYKGNELSGVQFGLKSYTWFQNQSAQREFDLKSQVWFQTKIAQHKVQLPPYYIHFEIVQIQDLVSSNILLMQYWAGLRLNSSIFFLGGGGGKRFGNKSCKICHMILFVFHFLQFDSGYFKQALKCDWLLCF